MIIKYLTTRGATVTLRMSRPAAELRLARLDEAEAETIRSQPTDSGDTRSNYLAEAAAIRAALNPSPPVIVK